MHEPKSTSFRCPDAMHTMFSGCDVQGGRKSGQWHPARPLAERCWRIESQPRYLEIAVDHAMLVQVLQRCQHLCGVKRCKTEANPVPWP